MARPTAARPERNGLGTAPDRQPRPAKLLGAGESAGTRAAATPADGAHVRIRRSQRTKLSDRSTVPLTAHDKPAMTTASSTHRTVPTG